jgi:serine phosphatase RsbU (regulator of sigma subunit)
MLEHQTLTVETKYRLLSEINQRLSGTLDLDLILEELLDSVASVIRFDAGGIFILNDDLITVHGQSPRQVIASIVWRGYPAHPAAEDPMLSHGHGIVGHVIRTGRHVVASDVRLDPHYVPGRENTLSEIAVPILIGGRTIGALNLESNRLAAYDESDADTLRFFADAAAVSIDKAMLHRRLMEQERLEEQMRLARIVQTRLLPAHAPEVPGYDVAGVCVPAFDIGGDYYDFIDLPDGRLGLTIADVSGEGIPAAMIMTAFRALLRTHARRVEKPDCVAGLLNQLLPDFTGHVDFVTAFYGVLDPATGAFSYVNCGHNPPFIIHQNGEVQYLSDGGPLLSILDEVVYASGEVELDAGDTLILYTDGIVELFDDAYQEYGLDRLRAIALRNQSAAAEDLIDRILTDARDYAQRYAFSDDLTLLVVRRLAAGSTT